MADPLKIEELLIAPHGPQPAPAAGKAGNQAVTGTSFDDALKTAQGLVPPGALRFSAHAQTRLQSRNIALGPAEMQRIEGAVQKAASKGARDSLVLMDQTALVVSVANRTVITVVDRDNLKQNVFTNIDSAVFA